MHSIYGKWLEVTTDKIGQSFMIICAGLSLYLNSGNIIDLYIGIVGSMLVIFTLYASLVSRMVKPEEYRWETGRRIKQKYKIDLGILRGASAILIWLSVGAVFNVMYYVFVFYFCLFHGVYLVWLFIAFRKHLS